MNGSWWAITEPADQPGTERPPAKVRCLPDHGVSLVLAVSPGHGVSTALAVSPGHSVSTALAVSPGHSVSPGHRLSTVLAVDELWPEPTVDLDIGERLAGDERPAPEGRPWVTLVMIMSLDGGIAVDGVSGGLGGPADQARFVAARRLAGGIVVGARTAAAEDYRPATVPIAVVSGSLSLDPDARLFSDPTRPPLVYTTTQAATTRGPVFDGIAEVMDFGDSLEPGRILADLRSRGILSVVLEGGPTLNGHFLAADVVDEVLLTVSPLALSGDSPRLAHGTSLDADHRFRVARVSLADDLIFVRYLRKRDLISASS